MSIIEWYDRQLQERPIVTKMWTAALLNAASNVASQRFIQRQSIDVSQVVKYASFNAAVSPVFHVFFTNVDSFVPIPRSHPLQPAAKVLADQMLLSPFINTLFVLWIARWEGKKANLSLVPTLVRSGWAWWIPVSFTSFTRVPPRYRSLFGNSAAFVWGLWLAWRAEQSS